MKAEKAHKIREMSAGELENKGRDLDERIFRVRFQAATTQGEGLNNLHALKLERARVKTALREKNAKHSPKALAGGRPAPAAPVSQEKK